MRLWIKKKFLTYKYNKEALKLLYFKLEVKRLSCFRVSYKLLKVNIMLHAIPLFNRELHLMAVENFSYLKSSYLHNHPMNFHGTKTKLHPKPCLIHLLRKEIQQGNLKF